MRAVRTGKRSVQPWPSLVMTRSVLIHRIGQHIGVNQLHDLVCIVGKTQER